MAVAQIKIAEHLLNTFISLPERSSFFNDAPARVRPKNQSQEISIQAAVKFICADPVYFSALVPITPIVSKIAWGFNKETDRANKICFFIGSASLFSVLVESDFQIV